MLENDKGQFAKIIRTTMQVCGGEIPDADVLRVWWSALLQYSIEDVSAAFSRYATRGKFPPKPADILEILDKIKPDGRPSADEAWAIAPKTEDASAVISDEMAEALSVAQPLIESRDLIAARMAFKAAYERAVEANKLRGIPPKWFPSLGSNPHERERAIADAVRLGRLRPEHGAALLPPERAIPMLEQAGKPLLLEGRKLSPEDAERNFSAMRRALHGKDTP